ncbi:MAG: DUF368 domain-containing protein [Anaerolineales bacterium]|nr:DUF368 domain-containing protein [Anaerolineales bacterium]MCB0007702.1 DUF368 domain-containing protein [Anaerolineales bacterium]MCB0012985.1 DUF368 domain-containing protein [Anaerolineales bacterium]MCB0019447.1 DUF368 domain-containing protein [Anaerolineales bacterium]
MVKTKAEPAADGSRKARTPQQYLGLVLRGMAMGASDIVPGVSGGTMAFILGIYEELINSIKKVGDRDFLKAVTSFNIRQAERLLNWPFLVAVATGIGISILTLSRGLEYLLLNQPVYLWSFFFGLVLASVVLVARRVEEWTPLVIGMLALAALGAFILVGLVPAQTPNAAWFLFLSGALAICAMVLPGVSGAFVLVLLGKYQFVLGAVNQLTDGNFSGDALTTIVSVGAGAAVGIVTFAQLFSWLFKRYHNMTVAILTGLMIGSLRKIWPWKVTLETMLDSHGEPFPVVQQNVLPALTDYSAGQIGLAIGLMAAGALAVLLLDYLANRKENS